MSTGKTTRSFFTLSPFNATTLKTNEYHIHIDGKNAADLIDLVRFLHQFHDLQGQVKVYPIQALHLGPQTKDAVYKEMMNFHPIHNGDKNEAFVTLSLGDKFNPSVMKTLLYLIQSSGKKFMTEVEKYTGEYTLTGEGQVIINVEYPTTVQFECNVFPQRRLDCPKMELHHGFDLPKISNELPINLETLMQKCQEAGLINGGWFVFADEKVWKYRTNEFSEQNLETCNKALFEQAKNLQAILAELGFPKMNIGSSLEFVLAIWQF